MEFRILKPRRNDEQRPTEEFARLEVGRGADKAPPPSPARVAYDEHLAQLEAVRLTGYRFLRPPGSSQTLKNIHEEEAFGRDLTGTMSNFAGSVSGTPSADSVAGAAATLPRSENEDDTSDTNGGTGDRGADEFDFTPNLSFPTLDASLPSIHPALRLTLLLPPCV